MMNKEDRLKKSKAIERQKKQDDIDNTSLFNLAMKLLKVKNSQHRYSKVEIGKGTRR